MSLLSLWHLFSHFDFGCIMKTKEGVYRGRTRDPEKAEAALSHSAMQRWPSGHNGKNTGLGREDGVLALPG